MIYEVACELLYPEGDTEWVTEMIEADSKQEALWAVDLIYPPVRWGARLLDSYVVEVR